MLWKSMGWDIFDVLDFVPFVGTVARLGQALDDHLRGDDAAARAHASMGGMNLGVDLLGLATAGLGRAVFGGARAATKVGVELAAHGAEELGLHVGAEVAVHGAAETTTHGLTSANLKQAFNFARKTVMQANRAIRPQSKLARVVVGTAGATVGGGSLAGLLLNHSDYVIPDTSDTTQTVDKPHNEGKPGAYVVEPEQDMFDVFIVPTVAGIVVFAVPIQNRTFWAGVTFTSAMAMQYILIKGE